MKAWPGLGNRPPATVTIFTPDCVPIPPAIFF